MTIPGLFLPGLEVQDFHAWLNVSENQTLGIHSCVECTLTTYQSPTLNAFIFFFFGCMSTQNNLPNEDFFIEGKLDDVESLSLFL